MKNFFKLSILLFFIGYAPLYAVSQVTDVIAVKKLTDRSLNKYLGRSVAVSGDIMVVGADGSASVYYRNSGGTNNWGFVKKLTGDNGTFYFGGSVSISGDVIVVGSPWDSYDSAGNNYANAAGSAYVFYRNSGGANNWGLIKKLTGKGTNGRFMNDYFGHSVSISGDVIVVGARGQRYDSIGNNVAGNAGAAYVFYRNSGGLDNWGFVKKLTGKGTNGRNYDDEFGYSVSISGDVIVAGARGQRFDSAGNNFATSAGAAYLFYRNSGGTNNWGFVKKLTGTGTNGRNSDDEFGYSVCISDDVIAVGAVGQDYDSVGSMKTPDAGAVYVFYRNSGGTDNWGFTKKLTTRINGWYDYLGCSISVSGDVMVAGAVAYGSNGSAYVFHRNNGGTDNWGFVKKLIGTGLNGSNPYDEFGWSVSVSGDVIVAGANSQDYDSIGTNLAADAGAAYVFHARGLCFAPSVISPSVCNIYKSPSGKYTWTTSGTYKDTIISFEGCDSIITINLTINNTTTSIISPVVCNSYKSPSAKYTWTTSGTYKDTIPNINGCDSVITINLTINNSTTSIISPVVCNNYKSPSAKYTWTTSGTYKDTIPNTDGCDSVITINLTINNTATSSISPVVCSSYISPSAKYTWTTSGTYKDTIPNVNGCDSVITVNLIINNSYSSISPITCGSYTSPSGKYTWVTSGKYSDTLVSADGCDSIITINLTVNTVNTNVTIIGAVITSTAFPASYKWLDCGNSYAALAGETSQVLNVTVNGTYAVEVTQNSCVDTSACYNITNVNVKETTYKNNLSVYPNPANGTVSISASNIIAFSLTDISGKKIDLQYTTSNDISTFDVSVLPAGVYFCGVETEKGKTTHKLLVQH